MITTKKLSKTFTRFEKEAGLKGSFKSLFRRKYIQKHAVTDFDLEIAKGECVGLIGENGAGKTTLIKMLTGIIAPTGGEVSVLRFTPNKLENAFKKRYAVVMGQKSQLFFELSAADTFLLFKELYDIPKEEFEKTRDELVDLFGVRDLLNVQVRTLSLGQRMKMELIAALLHNPEILFLDEPTIGLDAISQRQIRAFLKKINKTRGTTILLTSHYMQDIQSLCKRVVVIAEGKKVYDGGLDELIATHRVFKKITVSYADGEPEKRKVDKADVKRTLEELIGKGEVIDISVEEEDIALVVERIYEEAHHAQIP
jgi:ABC-type uncharacterized transport system, ATPase component